MHKLYLLMMSPSTKMKNLRLGQMLLEMVLAIAITGMVLVAVANITTQGLAGSNFSKSRTEANGYATELIEWMRKERDTPSSSFWSKEPLVVGSSANYCFISLSWPAGTGVCTLPISGTPYYRNVTLKNVDSAGKQMEIQVVVTWKEGTSNNDHKVTQVVNLAQY
jgi:hypothetical protein